MSGEAVWAETATSADAGEADGALERLGDVAPALVVTTDDAATTIVAARYRLIIPAGQASAYFADAAGTVWTRLALTGSVGRIGSADERYGDAEVRFDLAADDRLILSVRQPSSAWAAERTIVECRPDAVRIHVEVEGSGRLTDVTVLGGRMITPTGAAGTFRSSIGFRSVFVPTPARPVAFLRPASAAAQLGVVGDADPGRLNAVFAPPPLCFAFGRSAETAATAMLAELDERGAAAAQDEDVEPWLAVHLAAPVQHCGFTAMAYDPLDGGYLLRLHYEGHTTVDGYWSSPQIVLHPVRTALAAVADLRDDLIVHGWAPEAPVHVPEPWWTEPIFCGWGAQCSAAIGEWPDPAGSCAARGWDPWLNPVRPPGIDGAALARQDRYDDWLALLERHDIDPGTVVIDDRWQSEYGLNTVDATRWPDLRGWIGRQHERGRRVLLWFKAWDPTGLAPELCIRTAAGDPVCVDPGNPEYRAVLREQVRWMLSPDGLDADGFKVDFIQRGPSGTSLTGSAATDAGGWGIAALHLLMQTLYDAAHEAKLDAMVVAHGMHPSFADVEDVVRLNDMQERDAEDEPVPLPVQGRVRAAIATTALPAHPVDTDQWPMPNRDEWAEYVDVQPSLGIPALYYLESIDNSGEQIDAADLARVAQSWRDYRASRR